MELDEGAGARLRALAERDRRELDPAAQARIAAQIGQQGPRVVRRARQVRRAVQFGAAVSVLGLAWGASRLLPVDEPEVAAAPGRVPAAPVAQLNAPRVCEQRALAEPQRTADARDGAERFALGALGTVLAEPGSTLWLDASDPCRMRVRLLAGEVLVHADDLGGGELRVATDRGDVVVHGTVFSVARSGSELRVQVAEGEVAVVQHQRVLVPAIGAGQRALLNEGQPVRLEALTDDERAAMLARVAAVAAGEAQPAPDGLEDAHASNEPSRAPGNTRANGRDGSRRSVATLVQEADALWNEGAHEQARARYREAGALSGPTAEAAWLALARRELADGGGSAAQQALQEYAARFPKGALAAEAAGIAFRLAVQRGDRNAARQQAELLTRSYPHTAQADAAARWLAANAAP